MSWYNISSITEIFKDSGAFFRHYTSNPNRRLVVYGMGCAPRRRRRTALARSPRADSARPAHPLRPPAATDAQRRLRAPGGRHVHADGCARAAAPARALGVSDPLRRWVRAPRPLLPPGAKNYSEESKYMRMYAPESWRKNAKGGHHAGEEHH